jgi:hypothetical protein
MATSTKVTIMPRSFSSLKLSMPPVAALIAVMLAAAAGQAAAQQGTPQPPPNQKPPANVQRIEPGSDVPATNIPPKRGTEIVEHRNGGQVTEVEVTAGGSHYYMKPNNQPGNAQTNAIRAPQWKVGEFDLSGKRRAGNDAGQNTPTAADAPPPPPMPAGPGPDSK